MTAASPSQDAPAPAWLARWASGSRPSSGLSRDNRDVLFLLAVIAWTVAPHASRQPAWCVVLVSAALIWRATLAWRVGPMPSRPFLSFILALACCLTWWSHSTLLGQEAGVTLVVALTALKTLELRARRDAFVIFFLGFFLILTQFLYSQNLLTAASMLLAAWGLLTALTLANLPVGRPSLFKAARLAGRAALLGLPIMLVLFLLFPRLPPLWGRPEDALARTGLSGRMSLGQVAELAQDESVAMHVRFLNGTDPPRKDLYFRGPVLSHFDGVNWTAGGEGEWVRNQASGHAALRTQGAPLNYELTVEPSRQNSLALLEATPERPVVESAPVMPELHQRALQWTATSPISDRLRLHARAWTHFTYGPSVNELSLREHVELPPGRNPRTLAWAAALRRRPELAGADAAQLAQAVLVHIRTENFRYTLAPGLYGENAIDEFWMDRRAGFCEHFAAAFVVVMRALDVPARVVTGYQGGELNPVDGYWIVRNSDAHAWAEYWQSGVGWRRVDPTAAIAPERVERGRRLRPPEGAVSGALTALNPAFGKHLRAYWEAVNNGWNQWVLNYSQGRQLDTLSKLGLEATDWTDLARALVIALTNLSLAAAVWAWWEQRRFDPWLVAYARTRAVLEQADISAPAHQGPLSLARELRSRFGRAALPLISQLEKLDAQRYGPIKGHERRQPSRRQRRELVWAARDLVRAAKAHRRASAAAA